MSRWPTAFAIFDSFWRAVAYCLHPRVVLWSLLPLALAGAAVGMLGWAYWESTVGAVRSALERTELVVTMLDWLDQMGANRLRSVMAPMIVVALSVPLVVLTTLLLVAVLVTPAVVRTVAVRRFPALQRLEGCTWWQALGWSVLCTLAALGALVLSVPLWFVPPLVLVLPPLVWGWLTGRVFAYEALAGHASAHERRFLLRQRRWPLLAIGRRALAGVGAGRCGADLRACAGAGFGVAVHPGVRLCGLLVHALPVGRSAAPAQR